MIPAFTKGDIVTVTSMSLYAGVRGVVHSVNSDQHGVDVTVEVTDAPTGLLPRIPDGDRHFIHVEPTELCA